MKDVKIVVGMNYGDECKGLVSRHFCLDANKRDERAIVVFHNGTAQRGHTVDYTETFRHVYHHFGGGTADGVPTYFADTFLVHPMEFVREYNELISQKIYPPKAFCSLNAKIVTPFDMIVDQITNDWIEHITGKREYGSCCYGSWSATDREERGLFYTVEDFIASNNYEALKWKLEQIWYECIAILVSRGVDFEQLPQWKEYFIPNSNRIIGIINHYLKDFKFFLNHVELISFDELWKQKDYFIFENGQGLGLDKNVKNEWHTTSNTGMTNPYNMLKDKNDFLAETCYVTRSYLTRHGKGYLEEQVEKNEINTDMTDLTNVPNNFQGSLRYGFIEDNDQKKRVADDFSIVKSDKRFTQSIAVTHTNEFGNSKDYNTKYVSNNKFTVEEREGM